jgi:hypothetical protein
MKIRIGDTPEATERHPVEVLEDNTFLAAVERPNDDGIVEWVPAIQMTTATGQGTSPETIPLDEFEQYVEVHEAAVENGVPEEPEVSEDYVPTFEVLRQELRQGDHTTQAKDANGKPIKGERDNHGPRVFFRAATGQGRKLQRVRPEQYGEVVEYFRAQVPKLSLYQEQWETTLRPLVLEKARKDAEKAAAKAAKEAAKAAASAE